MLRRPDLPSVEREFTRAADLLDALQTLIS
jgi:precorrin-6A/cobalt-precorrin-6A reductase